MELFLNQYLFHWSPDKAIYIGGHSLSWDARCAGIYIGYSLGILYHAFSARKANILPPWPILIVITLLFLPLFLDVFSLKMGFRVPSNDVRYLSGLLFGYALSVYLYPAFVTLCCNKKDDKSSISSFGKLCISLALIGSLFFLKKCNFVVSYIILQILSFGGFLSLFVGFGLCIFRIFRETTLFETNKK